MSPLARPDSKNKLLDAAMHIIRSKGYSATTVDDICHHAGVTKGSFFHHFKSKEELALAAAQHFSDMADSLFASAPYRHAQDPLERVLGYVDFRASILNGELYEYTCLLGSMVQETYATTLKSVLPVTTACPHTLHS
jgi:TetR/AcrR family transcriptional repressor of nem operon